MHPKTKKLLIFLALFVLIFAGWFYWQTNQPKPNTQNPPVTATTATPAAVVESFIKATLGSLPDSQIDYDKAKTLMTTSYAAEFDTPMFIPQAYGMQDGPDSVEITDQEILTDTATVTVLGHWGTENQMYWKFELQKQAGDWKLNFINPGQ